MDYNLVVKNFKDTLVSNTLQSTRQYVGKRIQGRIYTAEQSQIDALTLANDCLKFIETLLTTELIDEKTFERIIEKLSNTVKNIDFLPENKRGIYGQAVAEEQKVYINPDMPNWKRKLYLFHELAHCCFKDRNTAPYIGDFMRHSTYYGYMTIEEALAQNIAETCYYASINQPRPQKQSERDRVIPNIQYQTNYDYYGLYQPLAIAFGRVLRGVGTSYRDSDDKILFDLSKKALKEDLLESVIYEYQKDSISQDLEPMFFALANIYSAKKMSFGMGGVEERVFDRNGRLVASKELSPTIQETQQYYMKALEIMKRNEDYRAPFEKTNQ